MKLFNKNNLNIVRKVFLLVWMVFFFEMSFPHYALSVEIDMENSTSGPVVYYYESAGIEDPGKQAVLPENEDKIPRFVRYVYVTAYSSTVDQCDSTPFITANNTRVRDGIVAANFLRFGTRIRIPEVFGDKEFEVTDRMNIEYDSRVDIWMETREEAKQFGIKYLKIEVY